MVLYFSATGNSMWVARQLAEALAMPVRAITEQEPTFAFFPDERPLILVFPVHSWGPAASMYEYVAQMSFEGYARQPVYVVCVCGDDCGRTDKIMARLLHGRGVDLTSAFSVQMPNNYILLPGFDVDKQAVAKQKLSSASARVREIVAAIKNGEGHSLYFSGRLPRLKSWIYPLFVKYARSQNRFYATEDCIKCGKCIRLCPAGVISADATGRPQWQRKGCVQCLACIHRCPQRAIEYGHISEKKGRYHHPDCP